MFKKLIDFVENLFNKDELEKIRILENELQELKTKLYTAEQQIEELSSVMSNYSDSNKFLVTENNQLRLEIEKINQNNEVISKFKEFMGELEFQELISLSNILVK